MFSADIWASFEQQAHWGKGGYVRATAHWGAGCREVGNGTSLLVLPTPQRSSGRATSLILPRIWQCLWNQFLWGSLAWPSNSSNELSSLGWESYQFFRCWMLGGLRVLEERLVEPAWWWWAHGRLRPAATYQTGWKRLSIWTTSRAVV